MTPTMPADRKQVEELERDIDVVSAACLGGYCGCRRWEGCKVADMTWALRDLRAAHQQPAPVKAGGEGA